VIPWVIAGIVWLVVCEWQDLGAIPAIVGVATATLMGGVTSVGSAARSASMRLVINSFSLRNRTKGVHRGAKYENGFDRGSRSA
jgi:hypothetical protein